MHDAPLYPLFKDLFIETNPGPVKAALAMMGQIEEEYRLPMVVLSPRNRDLLQEALVKCGVLRRNNPVESKVLA